MKCVLARAVQRAGQLLPSRYKLKDDTARGAAFAANEITYIGPACRTCTSTERYTSSGGCVHCTKAAVTQRGDGRPRRAWHHRKHGQSVPLQPEDSRCDCCSKIAKLVIDHDHVLEDLGFPGDETFRGWICYQCNNGIGNLGDDVAGVQQALNYLKRKKLDT